MGDNALHRCFTHAHAHTCSERERERERERESNKTRYRERVTITHRERVARHTFSQRESHKTRCTDASVPAQLID